MLDSIWVKEEAIFFLHGFWIPQALEVHAEPLKAGVTGTIKRLFLKHPCVNISTGQSKHNHPVQLPITLCFAVKTLQQTGNLQLLV